MQKKHVKVWKFVYKNTFSDVEQHIPPFIPFSLCKFSNVRHSVNKLKITNRTTEENQIQHKTTGWSICFPKN